MNTIAKTLVVCLITLCFTVAASAATFVVNTTADTADVTPGDGVCADSTPACSMRAAISEANALAGADIITVGGVTYTQTLVAANEDLNAGGDWDITSQITINGVSDTATIMQANAAIGTAAERVFNVRAGGNLTLTNMTVRNGNFSGTMTANTRGAGIENLGILTLDHVVVRDNRVTSTSGNPIAAGINNQGTAVTLISSTVTANITTRSVGVAGSASAFGGGMASLTAATLTFTDSSISGNSAVTTAAFAGFGFGAGLYLENVFNVVATNSHFDNNTGTGVLTGGGSNGGGIRALSAAGAASLSLTNCTLNGNTGNGSGTSHQGTALQLFTVTTTAATLTATIDRTTISGNSALGNGLGISSQANGGNLTVNLLNSTISGNTGGINGGGILATNAGSTLAGATVYNITNSTVSGHTVTGSGGGVAVEQPAASSTVTVNLNYATVANNRANNDNTGATDNGGGMIRASGTVNLKNSVIADNSIGTGGGTAPDLGGAFNSQDYNHIENLTGATITGTTTNNATGDPALDPLGANGGPTQTHLLNASSLALNTIPNGVSDCGTTITTDQRLLPRPSGGACDKGSTERAALAPGPWDLSGVVKDANGRPIRNIQVVITGGSLPGPIIIYTGMLGQYGVLDLPGASYTVSVAAKRFTFTPPSQVVNLGSDMSNVNFTADPGFGVQPPMGKDGVLLADRDGVLIGDKAGTNGTLAGDNAEASQSIADGVLIGDRGILLLGDGVLFERKRP